MTAECPDSSLGERWNVLYCASGKDDELSLIGAMLFQMLECHRTREPSITIALERGRSNFFDGVHRVTVRLTFSDVNETIYS